MKSKGESVSETVGALASVPLFSKLSESVSLLLARECRFKYLEKGRILFLQSDPSDAAYIVCTGIISIVLNSQDGREMVINEMHCGDLFGELGLLTNKPRSTSAIARTSSKLLMIPRQPFLNVVQTDHELALRMLEVTAGRLQMSGQRESALAFMDAQARLARLLLELEAEEQDKGYVTISQDELAHRTGLIRQTVAKVLGRWRRQGFLLTGRGHIVLLNYKALKELENKLLV